MSRRTAIVILNYNTLHFLREFLPGLIASTTDLGEVVVVDNASTDGSAEWVRNSYPHLRVISLDRNLGYAGGYNAALKQIEAEAYLLLNSDVRVEGAWLKPLLDRLYSDPAIAGVQPKVLSHAQADHFEYAGACGGYLDRWGYPFCRGRIFDEVEEDHGQYDQAQRVFWATGAAFLLRSEVFHALGGFDERFFAHMEEIDLCWRMQHLGYELWVEPASKVYHVGGGTLRNGSEFKYLLNYRNNLAMLTKNLKSKTWFLLLCWKLVLDGLSGLNFLIGGRPRVVLAILHAHFQFYGSLGYWLRARRATQRNVPEGELLYGHSVVWAYFGKGIRRFNQLKGSIKP